MSIFFLVPLPYLYINAFSNIKVHLSEMYLLVVDQFLFALKSFKFSELSYCQN